MYWVDKFGVVANPFTYTIAGLSPAEKKIWYMEGGGLELLHRMTADYPVYFPGGIITVPENFLVSTIPLQTLDDIKGLKVRTAGDDGVIFSKMGASVVFLPAGEIYDNIQKGVIDAAQISSPGVDWTFAIQEVISYMYMHPVRQPHEWLPIMINADSWAELPDDLKVLVNELVKAEAWNYYSVITQADLVAIEAFKDYGIVVERAAQPIVDELMAQAKILYAEYVAEDAFYAEVYNSIKDFQTAYWEAWVRM
jgi:TRAP-type mannitol/chloroaromatic compound transport system substrate-binding protein